METNVKESEIKEEREEVKEESVKKCQDIEKQNGINGIMNTTDDVSLDGASKGQQEPDGDTGDGSTAGITGGNETGLESRLARMPVSREAMRYSQSHLKRGHCVIFNHRYFDHVTGLGERNGTDRDRDQVQQLLKNLGFDVHVYNNLSVREIKDTIQDYSQEEHHSNCDMFAVVFMSHGEQDVLWGRDAYFKADFLFDQFTADRCKTLAGKPKLFFIQACRGDGLDSGVTLVRSQPSDETDSGYLAYKIPSTADFLICWSTVSGHYSWRNTTNGSWFVQSLVHVLEREASHDDLLSIMTSVNRYMINNFESNCPSQHHMHGKKQAASIVSTLMRKVYLGPKY
ncbi:hypothetical protein Pcinc_031799 [Petrolisthes cinctipes]|uniref:Caspase-1 n=1 Tax=Petrolisthes cinctipes TaxID=88211 RepID=A0AAE1K4B5_PETCI|nr:hypothetical protein Pcinc_031799 [Petrolisthes cinctipes]